MALDVLRDGFVSLCFDPSLNYADGMCRSLYIGQYIPDPLATNPVVPDVPIRILSPNDIDGMFGAGSVLAESLKVAFCQCPKDSEIWAIPRADGVAAVAAEYEMTVTGPATSDGTVSIFLGNEQWVVDVPVSNGDTAATIATAIAAAIPSHFPYTATDAAGIITFVAKNAGTVGNYLNPIYNWAGRRDYAPLGVSVAVVRTVTGTGAPAALNYANALGTCCYDCYALLDSDTARQNELRDWIKTQWSCDAPQCFGHGYTYDPGTLGQVLAKGNNAAELSRVAYPLNDANFPWLLVADYAAKSCCSACDNPELNIQGRTYGVLDCVKRPATCSEPWSQMDAGQLQAAGFVTWGPLTNATGTLTSPYIYNDVTNYLKDEQGRDNYTYRSTSVRRWAKAFGTTYAQFVQDEINGLSIYNDGTKIRDGVFGITQRMVRARVIAWLRDQEGDLIGALRDIDKQVVFQSDFDVSAPCRGKPGLYYLRLVVEPPVRISQIQTRILPKLLDNCERF